MNILAAEAIDLSSICELDNSVIGNHNRKRYLEKAVSDGTCHIAMINNSVVGFIICDTSFYENAFIGLVIVDPSFRRQGIGRALIRYIETVSPTEKLFTSTNESNEVMHMLCESLGFTRSGLIENLDDGDPEIVYFKRLPKGQKMSIVVKSERLILRKTRMDDLDFVLSAENNEYNRQFIFSWTRQQHEETIINDDMEHIIIESVVEKKRIGYIILSGLQNENQSIEFVRIVNVEKGNAYGRESIELIQKWVFEELNAHRLWLDVKTHNHQAKHVYDSVGFVTEDALRDCIKIGVKFEPMTVMSILRPEYLDLIPNSELGKYNHLFDFLRNYNGSEVILTYQQIENILGFRMPVSAHRHRSWWGNGSHKQAKSWLLAGWEVDNVELSQYVRFNKIQK